MVASFPRLRTANVTGEPGNEASVSHYTCYQCTWEMGVAGLTRCEYFLECMVSVCVSVCVCV